MTDSMLTPIAAILARKSTDQTGVVDEEKSVTRQVEQAEAYAARKGWVVDDRYIFTDDGVSGAEFVKRPGLLRLLSLLSPRPPFQRLIMSEESRLGREQIETAYILKRILDAGVRVFFYLEDRERTLDNPMDKIVLSLQHFASEMERERARLRTYDAMVRKAQAGHVTGGRVYGYDNVDVFAPDPGADGRPRRLFVSRRINDAQAAIIRRIFRLCAEGYGLTKTAKTLNGDGVAPPRRDGHGWAPTAVREILHRELYRGVIVWNRSQKVMRRGTRSQRQRPSSEWLRRPAEELRIVSDSAWEAAHKRLAGTRNTFRPRPGQSPARLDLTSPYLLSGLGRCALCGGSVIAMSRHHGRRRGFFYGCAYNSKRGPTVCGNNLHMPQEVLEDAVIGSVAASFEDSQVAAAIDRALELLEERREAAREGRSTQAEALKIVRAEEARLIDAVKQGQELNALVAALHKAQERRRTLKSQLAMLSSTTIDRLPDPERLRAALMKRAADVRRVLTRREPDVRRVLQAVVTDRLEFAPFNDRDMRGYQFSGTGSYGEELLGDTCPTSSGGPNGIRTRV
jgi:site-specific DNA recombinase